MKAILVCLLISTSSFALADAKTCQSVDTYAAYEKCRRNGAHLQTAADLEISKHVWLTEYLEAHPPTHLWPSDIQSFKQPAELAKTKLDKTHPVALFKHSSRPIYYFIFRSNIMQQLAFMRMAIFIESDSFGWG
jgi:hypothetical protein